MAVRRPRRPFYTSLYPHLILYPFILYPFFFIPFYLSLLTRSYFFFFFLNIVYFLKVVGIGSIISDHFNEKTRMYTYTYKVLLSSAKWQYQSKHSSGGKMSRSLLRVLLYCSMDGVTLQCVGSMESTNFAVRSTRQLRRRGQSQSQKKKRLWTMGRTYYSGSLWERVCETL